MTDPRSQTEQENPAVAFATGVASGGLGTGANLDDTQVFRTEDLRTPAASSAESEQAPAAAAVATPQESAPVAAEVPTQVARRVTNSNGQRGRGLVGVLAAALVVLAGVAFVVTQDAGTPAAGQTVPSAAAPATTQPDGAAGGAGNGDPGNGKEKPCRGNGNGRGCDDD